MADIQQDDVISDFESPEGFDPREGGSSSSSTYTQLNPKNNTEDQTPGDGSDFWSNSKKLSSSNNEESKILVSEEMEGSSSKQSQGKLIENIGEVVNNLDNSKTETGSILVKLKTESNCPPSKGSKQIDENNKEDSEIVGDTEIKSTEEAKVSEFSQSKICLWKDQLRTEKVILFSKFNNLSSNNSKE